MQQLSADTVRLLSSSQVITSVLNVVKELMENSLDAGATCIHVTLENYGLDRVEVRDNGEGIKVEDTPVMAVRHYTSKICSHDDLETLDTYGFRGEALGSICAVAEVCVTTKTKDDDISTQYSLDLTGTVLSQKPSHLGQGTSVCVLKLFKNLPVRRQYYTNPKKCKEELKKIQDLLIAYAIVKPELRLTLTHNKVVAWQKAKVSDHRSALLVTLGSAAVANLVPCHHDQLHPQISLDGFFPKPGADYTSTSSTSHDKTFLFINNRPVHNKDIMKLLRQHYQAQYPQVASSRYPTLMLRVTVQPSALDVNLTPDKTQVLLHNKEAVLTAVEAILVSLYGYRAPQPPGPLPPDGTLTPDPLQPDGTFTPDPLHSDGTPTPDPLREPDRRSSDAPLPLGTDRDTATSPGTESVTPVERHSADGGVRGPQSVAVGVPGPQSAANSSSSSSVAEDWVVNTFDPSLLLNPDVNDVDDATAANHPECSWADSLAEDWSAQKQQPSAETWSAGTALSDPVSGKPLEPVRVHQAVSTNHHDNVTTTTELPGQSVSPNRKSLNSVTEKGGTLTAYDLISQRASRAPLSPAQLFHREARAQVLTERPAATMQEISAQVHLRWENLGDTERHKYEEKAKQQQQEQQQRTKLLSSGDRQRSAASPQSRPQGVKRKAPPNHQQLLDELFSAARPPKTRKPPADAKPCQPLPFSVAQLRLRHGRLCSQRGAGAAPRGLRLVKRLASQSSWLVLRGPSLMLLNPFRVEEALLFKRLVENNILPAVSLRDPVHLTDGVLGGAQLTQALCGMEREDSCGPDGSLSFTDPRLLANGFRITLTPADGHLEVTAMADCVPFMGVEDLRELLNAVLHRSARTVRECRPLKVTNYLQGEAVRLARQLPTHLSQDDVQGILLRMERQLGDGGGHACIHGRPLLHHLCDIPDNQAEATALLRLTPLQL